MCCNETVQQIRENKDRRGFDRGVGEGGRYTGETRNCVCKTLTNHMLASKDNAR